MAQENRTKYLKIRVTEEESAEISKRAKTYGFNVSDYVRRSALSDGAINPLYSKPVKEFLNSSMGIYRTILRCPDPSRIDSVAWKEVCKEYGKEVENLWHFLR